MDILHWGTCQVKVSIVSDASDAYKLIHIVRTYKYIQRFFTTIVAKSSLFTAEWLILNRERTLFMSIVFR